MKKSLYFRDALSADASIDRADKLALSLRDPEVSLQLQDSPLLEMDPTGALDRALAQRAVEARDISARSDVSLRPVRELLNAGWARVDLSHELSQRGAKPLIRACKARDEELLSLLLKHGSPPHWGGKGQLADTAMGLCLKKGWIQGARLISAYLTPEHFELRDGHGDGLMEALFAPSVVKLWSDRKPLALALAPLWIEKGADLNARGATSCNGAPALIRAIRESESDQAALALIQLGPDLEAVDNSGATPLIAAARKGMGEIVELLLSLGVDPLREDKKGRTARDWAKEGAGVITGASREKAIKALTDAERVAREKEALGRALEQGAAELGRALAAAFESGAVVLIDGESLDRAGFMERFGGAAPAKAPKRGLKL